MSIRKLFFFAIFLKNPLKVIEAKKANSKIEIAKLSNINLFYNYVHYMLILAYDNL
jgi:hypothetical protein